MQQQRRERVELETTRHRVVGSLTLAANGFRSRVSDLLNASEREFLALTDVVLEPLDGGRRSTASSSRSRARTSSTSRRSARSTTQPPPDPALSAP
jgi:hypothetical protein